MTARSRAASSRHIAGTSWHSKGILHDAGTRSAAAHAHPVLPSSFKKLFGTSRENIKKTDAWAAQARKEVAPQPRGHLTTRRQLPTASTNAYRHAGDSCIAGTLVFRGRLLEFSPSTLRRSGAGGREGALVSARCKGCSYDAECSANYTADVYTLLCATHRSLRKK